MFTDGLFMTDHSLLLANRNAEVHWVHKSVWVLVSISSTGLLTRHANKTTFRKRKEKLKQIEEGSSC